MANNQEKIEALEEQLRHWEGFRKTIQGKAANASEIKELVELYDVITRRENETRDELEKLRPKKSVVDNPPTRLRNLRV